VAIATAAEVFVVLALLWTTDSNFRRVTGRAFGAVTKSKWEIDTNRFGGDYTLLATKADHIELCEEACRTDLKCLAWTYVKPGVQGAQANCWLKSIVPAVSGDTCCVSGTKVNPK
jgi:hypothetical protein